MNDWEMTKALIADSAKRFVRETADHKMAVLHDDGLYRHLRFSSPKNPFYWFDLITTPWVFLFRGDGESFVFTATEDMLGWFFRNSQGAGDSTHIQPDHWSSKLASDRDSVKEFSQERFDMEAAEYLEQVEEDFPGVTAAWIEFTTGVTAEHSTEYKETAQWAVSNFEFGELEIKVSCSCGAEIDPMTPTQASAWSAHHERDNDSSHELTRKRLEPFAFEGTEEWLTRDFGWWFLWACHAIVWGIRQYDAAKLVAPVPALDAAATAEVPAEVAPAVLVTS
jgi:hypothetical protein